MYNIVGKYIRNKALKNCKSNRVVSFKNLRDISSIGFVIKVDSPDSADDLIYIVAQLKQLNIQYKGVAVVKNSSVLDIAIESNNLSADYLDNIKILRQSDISFFKEPKSGVLDDFYSTGFDVFVNINPTDNITLDCVAIASDVNYLVGLKGSTIIPYSMVLLGEKGVILSNKEFFNLVLHYLGTIECCREEYNE